MIIKFDYNNFLIMDGERLLSISHHFFPVFTCKNRIMLSARALQLVRLRSSGLASRDTGFATCLR